MKELRIAKELSMPVSATTQKLAWLGTTGSGKTYGASKFAEELWSAGAQFVTLDPVGVWYGLRLAKDGKKPSKIDIPVFGGLHGDIPLEPTSGKLIANLIVDKNLSVILDVSQFDSDAAKARFATDFCDQFFFRKKASPSAVHIFLEECQEFVPQNPQREEARMLHSFTRMQKLGRNFGIGSSLISQRPQEVNKKALNMAQTLFVFRTTGTHERKAIEAWIKDNSLDENIANDLPKIPTGECHVWSPEFLKVSEMVHILEKQTFNASATPEVGKKAKAASLSSIDVKALRESMAEVVAKAEKDDPVALRRRIAELEKGKNTAKVGGFDQKFVEKAVKDAQNTLIREVVMPLNDKVSRLTNALQSVAKAIAPFSDKITISGPKKPIVVLSHQILPQNPPVVKESFTSETPADGDKPLSKGALQILSYLAQVHPNTRTKAQLWVATGYAPGGGFNNLIYELTGRGYISKNGEQYEVVGGYDDSIIDKSFDPSLDKWYSKLSKGAGAIFKFMLSRDHEVFAKEHLAQETGYALGGGFNNLIYELTGKELIEKTGTHYKINPEILDL